MIYLVHPRWVSRKTGAGAGADFVSQHEHPIVFLRVRVLRCVSPRVGCLPER